MNMLGLVGTIVLVMFYKKRIIVIFIKWAVVNTNDEG